MTSGIIIAARQIVPVNSGPPRNELEAKLFCLLGKWLSDTGADTFEVISHFLEASAKFFGEGNRCSKAHFILASFSDKLYQDIFRLESSERDNQLHLEKEEELESCKKVLKNLKGNADPTFQSDVKKLQRQCTIYREETEQNRRDKATFLESAAKHYLKSLSEGTKYDTHAVFRVCSLLFNNADNIKLARIVSGSLKTIPTYKWVTLVYQIASRLGSNEAEFHKTINRLLAMISIAHPHHCLFQLFALRNSEDDSSKKQAAISKLIFASYVSNIS